MSIGITTLRYPSVLLSDPTGSKYIPEALTDVSMNVSRAEDREL